MEILKLEIGKLELKPGDCLAVKFVGNYLIHDEINQMTQKLKELVPKDVGVIMFCEDVELTIIKSKGEQKP